jgi:two-component system, OmpR family, sensor histidine kinase VicK
LGQSIPAEQKIREIEEGIEHEYYKVITDHEKASQILVELAKSVKEEALILLPNDKSMVRLNRLGVIDYAIKASQENHAEVKIICPLSDVNSEIIKKISDNAPNIKILNGINSPYGMYIVDGQKFLRAELRVAEAEIFSEAIGFTFYSNSKLSVDSFKSVFELLWKERMLNEELIRADKMQQEFINIASHEIKTPVQSILTYSEIIQRHPERRGEMMQAICRNAVRLQRLTNNILDATRIESQSLKLDIEKCNLIELISGIVEDYRRQIERNNRNVKLLYNAPNKQLLVEADKVRLTQVLSNLLTNAVKFTEKGTISITISEEKEDNKGVVSIKDTGTGIDPEIFPRLFTKFATKSFEGTGLGLFISKSIVQAHSGRMWAKNNADGRGATFDFTLPITDQIK